MRDAKVALAWLGMDFQDAETCLAEERLKLADGWRRLSIAVDTAQSHDERARAMHERDTTEAEGARARALQEAEAAIVRREEAEALLKELQDQHAEQARSLLAWEGALATREKVAAAREADLESRMEGFKKKAAEQAMEKERLETLGRQLADAQEAHTKHVTEANAQLEAKEKKVQEDADAKEA